MWMKVFFICFSHLMANLCWILFNYLVCILNWMFSAWFEMIHLKRTRTSDRLNKGFNPRNMSVCSCFSDFEAYFMSITFTHCHVLSSFLILLLYISGILTHPSLYDTEISSRVWLITEERHKLLNNTQLFIDCIYHSLSDVVEKGRR